MAHTLHHHRHNWRLEEMHIAMPFLLVATVMIALTTVAVFVAPFLRF